MRVEVLAFGKLKTPGMRDSADYYKKLISGFVSLNETELKPIAVPDKSPATRALIQAKEADLLSDKLKKVLSGRGVFYLLDETGKSVSTEEWSKRVTEWENESIPEVAFCIGSSLGFSPELRKRARGVLSFGPQTLPHELARVVLFEQLYRAWSVTRGHPYHVAE